MLSQDTIRIFKTHQEAEAAIGTYGRTTWKSERYKEFLPVRIDAVKGPLSGQRYFLDTTLIGLDRKQELPLDNPLVPISEEEATKLANHILQAKVTEDSRQDDARKRAPKVATSTSSLIRDNNQPPEKEITMTENIPTPVTETSAEKSKQPTIYGILAAALREGKSKQDAVAAAAATFPAADIKKIKQAVHSVAAQQKGKTK